LEYTKRNFQSLVEVCLQNWNFNSVRNNFALAGAKREDIHLPDFQFKKWPDETQSAMLASA